MKLHKFKVDDLKLAEYNPRKELKPGDPEFDKLKRSIEEFGYVEPILINTRNMRVVGGHQRLTVMKHLGATEVDCVVVDLDEQKEKALNIALNKISGAWDDAKLADLLKELQLDGYDTSLTGFDLKELDILFAGTTYEVQEDNFDVEGEHAAIDKPSTKSGDIWQLGRHKLLCGDSTATTDVKKLMDGKLVDLVVTDPPYNVEYSGKTEDALTIQNDSMSDESFQQFLLSFYEATFQVIKGGGVVYVFHATRETVNFVSAMKKAGFKMSQTLVWAKDHFTLGRSDYQWQHEPILYGWKEKSGEPHYFIYDRTQSTIFENKAEWPKKKKEELLKVLEQIFESFPSDIVRDSRPVRNGEHPTMKPITLCARLIRNSSREGEIVYDAFAGSGSTLMACEQMHRTSYNMELDEKYCDVIVRRFSKMFPEVEVTLIRNGEKLSLGDAGFTV
jgi:DNA modification methylase